MTTGQDSVTVQVLAHRCSVWNATLLCWEHTHFLKSPPAVRGCRRGTGSGAQTEGGGRSGGEGHGVWSLTAANVALKLTGVGHRVPTASPPPGHHGSALPARVCEAYSSESQVKGTGATLPARACGERGRAGIAKSDREGRGGGRQRNPHGSPCAVRSVGPS